MKKIFILLIGAWVPVTIFGQDPQFTLFDSHRMLINPAFTGDIDDDYSMRVGIQHRQQWFDALQDYYNHSAVVLDNVNPICFRYLNNITFTSGLYIIQEQFPTYHSSPRLINQKIGMAGGIRRHFPTRRKQNYSYLAIGAEFELLQKQLQGADKLTFGTQFDGMGGFDNNASNQEPLILTSGNLSSGIKPALSAGVAFVHTRGDIFAVRMGVAVHHLNRPILSLLDNEQDDESAISHQYSLYYRVKYSFLDWNDLNSKGRFGLQHYGYYARQGLGIRQYILGIEMGTNLAEHLVAVGVGARLTNSRSTSDDVLTDFYGSLRWGFDRYAVGMSFDFANSSFANGVNDRTATAIELTLSYLFLNSKEKDKCKVIPCPRF